MCLAVPAQLSEQNGDQAVADLHGNRVRINTVLVPEAGVGDWVLVHAGFAIQRLDAEAAARTWSVLEEIDDLDAPDSKGASDAAPDVVHDSPQPAHSQDGEGGYAMSRRHIDIRQALDRLHDAAGSLRRHVTFMEVCGTHTMSAFRSGLHSLMPDNVTLLSGPGCPVCVTAQGDIDLMIETASLPGVRMTLCTYGDMLRVPGRRGSLEKARSRGADVANGVQHHGRVEVGPRYAGSTGGVRCGRV